MKYIKKIEGVGDKYAEKRFFIKDPAKEFDIKYQTNIQNIQPIAYVKSSKKEIPIFKNPKSLKLFEAGVRAIATIDGDLFVAQGNYEFFHANMGVSLGFGKYDDIYKMNNKLVFLYRDENTNSFHIGDSTEGFNDKSKKNKKITENILRNVKRKNPKYDFYNSYGIFFGTKPVSLIETKPKKGFLSRMKDLMFENVDNKLERFLIEPQVAQELLVEEALQIKTSFRVEGKESERKRYLGIKKDDVVVFVDEGRLINGQKYIVNSVLDNSFSKTDTVKDSGYFITVKEMNGNIILYQFEPMIFYAYRFIPELEYKKYLMRKEEEKYNL